MDRMKVFDMTFGQIVIYAIYVFAVIAEVILGFRFFLLLFGANPDAPFVNWVYTTSYHVMAPFRGIFDVRSIGENSYFDFAGLFGMLAYMMLAYWLTYVVSRFEYKKMPK